MLRVSINMKQGIYIISEDDGQKEIRVPMSGKYDKTERLERIQALKNYPTFTPEEKSKMIDFGLYDALQEFDSKYGTAYAKRYFDTTTKQIPYSGQSEKESAYKKRQTQIKSKEFSDAGISFQYNVSLLGGPKEMSFGERLRIIRQALTQRKNGVKVRLSDSKQPLLEAPVVKTEPIVDDIPDMPDEETLKKMREEIAKAKAEIDAKKAEQREELKGAPIITEQPKAEEILTGLAPQSNPSGTTLKTQVPSQVDARLIEQLANPNQRNIDEILQNMKAGETENPEIDAAPVVSELEQAILGRRVASPIRESQTPKKKISRSKAIQASKKAQREAGRLKNSYQGRIDAKAKRREEAERRATDPEQIRLAAERRAEKEEQRRIAEEQRKAAEAEQKRLDAERKRAEEEKKRQEAENSKKSKRILAFSAIGAKAQIGNLATRFTRQIKDKADSIRNKKFVPSLTHKQKKIAKAATIVALVAALSIGTGAGVYKLLNAHSNNIENPVNTPGVVETVKPSQDVDKDGIDYILGEQDTQKPTTQTPSQEENIKPSAPVQEENQGQSEEDSKKEYLSSIKVGASMSINSGRYFETPEGQGNYGHFENFTDGVKEINMIDVMTEEGYKVITDSNVNVYELKQQYPNAKFAYHIVCRNQDGSTTVLGWLTEASMDQNMDQNMNQQHNIVDLDER